MSFANDLGFNEPFTSLDTWDVSAIVASFLGFAVLTGLAVVEFAGVDLMSTVYTIGDATDITYAVAIPAAGLATAVFTNGLTRDDFGNMSNGEQVAIGGSVLLLVVMVFAPDLASTVQDHLALQLGVTGAGTLAATIIASE